MKFSSKLIITYVVSVIVIISIVAGMAFYYADKTANDRLEEQLKSVVVLKESSLNEYFFKEAETLRMLSRSLSYFGYAEMLSFLSYPHEKKEVVRSFLVDKINDQKNVLEYSILTLNGVVYLSTSLSEEEKIFDDREFFLEGKKGTFVQSFYFSQVTKQPEVIISTPLLNSEGILAGVLTAKINLHEMSRIMEERSGLGDTGETILVDKYNTLVSKSRFVEGIEFKKRIYTDEVKDCLLGNSKSLGYYDYRGVEVISYYEWNVEREACFIAKIDKKEAESSLTSLRVKVITIALILVFLLLIVGVVLGEVVTQPLQTLRESVIKFGLGKFKRKIRVKTKDEIGELAREFNKMAAQINFSEQKLNQHAKKLEKEVKLRTKELQKSKNELEKKVNESKKTELATLNILEDVEESREKLKELDKLKTEFLSTVSHELRTPITPIKSQVQRLIEKNLPRKERKEALEMVLRNTVRLDRLIMDVLEISRIQSKKLTIYKRKDNILQLVQDNIKTMSPIAKEAGITLDFISKCRSKKDLSVYIDRDRITEVLINLIDNAIKYSGSQKITVRLICNEHGAEIKVIDYGVGIPEDEQPRIFESFFRGRRGLEIRPEGTGLGLSICKGIIESHGGKMWMESRVGQGTTFSVIIPKKKC
jgi:signal transduction histidine kinase